MLLATMSTHTGVWQCKVASCTALQRVSAMPMLPSTVPDSPSFAVSAVRCVLLPPAGQLSTARNRLQQQESSRHVYERAAEAAAARLRRGARYRYQVGVP